MKDTLKDDYIQRVYNSLALVIIMQVLFIFLLIVFVINNNNVLYWVTLVLAILNLIPITGGVNIIYNYNKDEKEKEL